MSKGISFRDAFLYWLKLGFISFGGPTGQIAMMCKEVVTAVAGSAVMGLVWKTVS